MKYRIMHHLSELWLDGLTIKPQGDLSDSAEELLIHAEYQRLRHSGSRVRKSALTQILSLCAPLPLHDGAIKHLNALSDITKPHFTRRL